LHYTRAFNEFLYEFLGICLVSENSLKFGNFFAEVTNSRSMPVIKPRSPPRSTHSHCYRDAPRYHEKTCVLDPIRTCLLKQLAPVHAPVIGKMCNASLHASHMPDPQAPFTRHNLLSNRSDNRVNVCIHDTTSCQTHCQTGCQMRLTTGCIVYTNIQPVVKPCLSNRLYNPVWQPVERTAVRSTRFSIRLSNPFDNRLYRVNGVLELCRCLPTTSEVLVGPNWPKLVQPELHLQDARTGSNDKNNNLYRVVSRRIDSSTWLEVWSIVVQSSVKVNILQKGRITGGCTWTDQSYS